VKSFVIALAFLVSGCATTWSMPLTTVTAEDQGKMYVCLDLPDAVLPDAHKATSRWDTAIHQWRHVVVVDHASPWMTTCSKWVHETTIVPKDDSPTHVVAAYASAIGGSEILLIKGRYERDVAGILMHELGHSLGAQHVPGTLMDRWWAPGTYVCPDKTTVAQVAAWNQVDVRILSWCDR
jgi:hypothetical protein